MPRAKNFDYDKTEDGRPSAAHIWEEQFFTAGHRGPPPADSLKTRIKQIEAACLDATKNGGKPMNGWLRELDWRRRQLHVQEPDAKEAVDVSDPEHPK